jgi:hypothetical protein
MGEGVVCFECRNGRIKGVWRVCEWIGKGVLVNVSDGEN